MVIGLITALDRPFRDRVVNCHAIRSDAGLARIDGAPIGGVMTKVSNIMPDPSAAPDAICWHPAEEPKIITVTRAEAPQDLDAVRDLVRTIARWAMSEIGKSDNLGVFAVLEGELAGLLGRYGPPTGCHALARLDGVPSGCVAFFGRIDNTMEIKRMYVLADARGHGVGGRMLDLLLTEVRAIGHRRCLLWGHHSMHAAHAVYEKAGFRKVPSSDDFVGATEGVDVCMEMTLRPEATA